MEALMNQCWMHKPICSITLGKSGDAMIMLPGMKAIYDATGIKPVFMIAEDFASVLDGVSYVEPWPVKLNWWRDGHIALRMAKQHFDTVLVGKFWDCKGAKPPLKPGEPTTTLKFGGRDIVVSLSDWQSYQLSQWTFAGFTFQQMMDWPLVFDKRDATRELWMRKQWFKTQKPKLLYNLSPKGGNTSPFAYLPEIWPLMQRTLFELVDISVIRAHRIYDLLGLYDYAAGLLTFDSAPLHLASASNVPYIAFIADGGSGSIPKGNCILSVRYSDVLKSLDKIKAALQQIVNESNRSQPHSDSCQYSRLGHPKDIGSPTSAS